jgi:PST family polysaccharide transporter
MTRDFKNGTITGVGWSALSQAINQGFTLGISIVLARILGPKAYGMLGMVNVFTGFAGVFGDLGLGAAIIQRKELEVRHLNAAFWANVAMGTAMTLIMAALTPAVAWFYHEPLLVPLTAVVALRYVIDSLNVVQMAILNREMQFSTVAKIQVGGTVAAGLAGLVLALCGFGPWSLVGQTLVGAVVGLFLAWCLAPWRPSFSVHWRAAKELFGFSAYLLGANIIQYWARAVDQLLIGRFLSATALGTYSRAYSLMLLPLNQVSRVVGQVMFPSLSAIQDDRPRIKRIYLKAIGVIALITFPMMTGLFAVSDHLIPALLGDKWRAAIPIVKILCWVGLLQSISSTVGWLYLPQGRSDLVLAMGTIFSAVIIVAFLVGIHWGLMGVVWSYFIINLALTYPVIAVPGRLVGLSFSEVAWHVAPALFCAASMGAAVWVTTALFLQGFPDWVCLMIQVPLGTACYFALVRGLRLGSWSHAQEVMRTFLDSGRGRSVSRLLRVGLPALLSRGCRGALNKGTAVSLEKKKEPAGHLHPR